jgi:hypothetical protein
MRRATPAALKLAADQAEVDPSISSSPLSAEEDSIRRLEID